MDCRFILKVGCIIFFSLYIFFSSEVFLYEHVRVWQILDSSENERPGFGTQMP